MNLVSFFVLFILSIGLYVGLLSVVVGMGVGMGICIGLRARLRKQIVHNSKLCTFSMSIRAISRTYQIIGAFNMADIG